LACRVAAAITCKFGATYMRTSRCGCRIGLKKRNALTMTSLPALN
jgi:hypothetical protein